MTPAGEATRARIVEAAQAEFARYGLAGARVDRIAASARANKAQLYAYFGNKDTLFDTVFGAALESIVNASPMDATDLPGYAVWLYDEYLRNPDLVRLAIWSRLERSSSGHLTTETPPRRVDHLDKIVAAQEAGYIDPSFDPFDVLVTVIALSLAWSPSSAMFTGSSTDPETEHDRRRAILRTLVARAYPPPVAEDASARSGSA